MLLRIANNKQHRDSQNSKIGIMDFRRRMIYHFDYLRGAIRLSEMMFKEFKFKRKDYMEIMELILSNLYKIMQDYGTKEN